jgi:hypothetical protein
MNISIDSFDIIMCVALVGGFMTGEWLPFIFLSVFAASADILGERQRRRKI